MARRIKTSLSITLPPDTINIAQRVCHEERCNTSEAFEKSMNFYNLHGLKKNNGIDKVSELRRQITDEMEKRLEEILDQQKRVVADAMEKLIDLKIEAAMMEGVLNPEIEARREAQLLERAPLAAPEALTAHYTPPVKTPLEQVVEARVKVRDRVVLYGLEKKNPNSYAMVSRKEGLQDSIIKWSNKVAQLDNGHSTEEADLLEESVRLAVEQRGWGPDILDEYHNLRDSASYDRSGEVVKKKLMDMNKRR